MDKSVIIWFRNIEKVKNVIWRHCPECGSWIRKTEENCPECGCLLEREAGAEWIGQVIPFGTYPQGPNGEVKPIEWQILEVRDGKALLLSKYGLDVKRYNEEWSEITWETCTLRAWLNGRFIDTAFNEREQDSIETTDVRAQEELDFDVNVGNDTRDRVFLLSMAEIEDYFGWDECICMPTGHALARSLYARGGRRQDGLEGFAWWLRSPGYRAGLVAYVGDDGRFDDLGTDVNDDRITVRPALWIKFDQNKTTNRPRTEEFVCGRGRKGRKRPV